MFLVAGMYMKKIYPISPELKPWVEKVLMQNRIHYLYRGTSHISADVSGKEFHRIVARARCEKRNFEEELYDGVSYWIPKIERKSDVLKAGYTDLIEMPLNK